MYPGPEVLQEVGRITIAGSRLDLAMAHLWHYLDRNIPYEETRKRGGSEQDRWVRTFADVRLTGPLRGRVLDALRAADAVRHADRLLSRLWATRPGLVPVPPRGCHVSDLVSGRGFPVR